jgi:energy-coupling factor transport system substrate-specific component
MGKHAFSFNTRMVVTVSIGTVLYGIASLAAVPIGPNTQLRPSIAILTLFAVYFGPLTGFLTGFLGHILTDMLAGWGIWWNWGLASGIFGFAAGLVFLFPGFNIKYGLYNKFHIIFLAVSGIIGFLFGYSFSGITDITLMGKPPGKVFFQAVIIFTANSFVFLFFSIPIVISFLFTNRKNSNLEIEI